MQIDEKLRIVLMYKIIHMQMVPLNTLESDRTTIPHF